MRVGPPVRRNSPSPIRNTEHTSQQYLVLRLVNKRKIQCSVYVSRQQQTDTSNTEGVSKSNREQLWFGQPDISEQTSVQKFDKDFVEGGEAHTGYWERWTEKKIQEVLDMEYEVNASHRVQQLLSSTQEQCKGAGFSYQDNGDSTLIPFDDQYDGEENLQVELLEYQDSNKKQNHKMLKKRGQGQKQRRQQQKINSNDSVNSQAVALQQNIIKSSFSNVNAQDRRKIRREGINSMSVESAASVGAYVGVEAGVVINHALRQARYGSQHASHLTNLPSPPLNSKRYSSTLPPQTQTTTYVLFQYSIRQPILTKDQKTELTALAQQSIKIARMRNDLENDLNREATALDLAVALGWTVDAVRQRITHGRRAREVLIRSHLSMVLKIADKYTRKADLTIEDLVAEGLIGLNLGIEKHDMKRGSSVTTTLFIYARNAMWCAIASEQSVVCIPRSAREQAYKVQKALKANPKASVTELAKLTKLKEANVNRALQNLAIQQNLLSSTIKFHKLKDQRDIRISISERLEFTKSEQNEDMFRLQEQSLSVHQLLQNLTDSERDIIVKLYGLEERNSKPARLQQLAEELSISRTSLRRKIDKILEKLKEIGVSENIERIISA